MQQELPWELVHKFRFLGLILRDSVSAGLGCISTSNTAGSDVTGLHFEKLDQFSKHLSSSKLSGCELKEINNSKTVNLITGESDPERIDVLGEILVMT